MRSIDKKLHNLYIYIYNYIMLLWQLELWRVHVNFYYLSVNDYAVFMGCLIKHNVHLSIKGDQESVISNDNNYAVNVFLQNNTVDS